jgi:hypothetical protein
MKRSKTRRDFFFKDLTHEQVMDQLNTEYPVSLKYNEDLIDRVCAKYPLIDKIEASIVVKGIFQSMRDFLILGKVINLNSVFYDFKFQIFKYVKDGLLLPSLRAHISTPKTLRKK